MATKPPARGAAPPKPKPKGKPRTKGVKAVEGVAHVPLSQWVPGPRKPSPDELRFGDPARRDEIWHRILMMLGDGLSLNKACAAIEGGPHPQTVLRWSLSTPEAARQYADARTIGYNLMAEEVRDISDTPQRGKKTVRVVDPDGDVTTTETREEMLGHRRLQTDTRKWLLSKCLPKIYGERTTIASETNDALSGALADIAKRLPV